MLTKDSLLIANTGKPFGREDVIGLCYMNLGSKQDEASNAVDTFSDFHDDDLIECINQIRIKEYSDVNRLRSDASHEQGSERDYGGRFLVELLQNADDAMSDADTTASDLIGCKGLGFISVFEITKEPEIYSGSFYFRFSSTETYRSIKEQYGFDPIPKDFTGLIPHKVPLTANVDELLKNKGYATVIRLPIDLKHFQEIKQQLKDFDHRLLLLCQQIRKIDIDVAGENMRTFSIEDRSCDGLPDGKISMRTNEGSCSYYCWSQTEATKDNSGKRSSASICLSLDHNDSYEVMPDTPPLHVFFPTEEKLPFHTLIHIALDLEQNRKHVREDEHSQNQNKHALELFKSLIGKMTEDVPADVLLQALVPDSDFEEGTVANRLWAIIHDVLINKRFIPVIGGEYVTPPSVQTWKRGLGEVLDPANEDISQAHLADPTVNNFKSKLEKLGAKALADEKYPKLLAGCINSDAAKCLQVINVIHEYLEKKSYISDDELQGFRKVPCWWLASTTARALIKQNTQSGTFLRSPKQPPPEWLKIDVLDDSFQNKWSELSGNCALVAHFKQHGESPCRGML
jgi:hypothetical protein